MRAANLLAPSRAVRVRQLASGHEPMITHPRELAALLPEVA